MPICLKLFKQRAARGLSRLLDGGQQKCDQDADDQDHDQQFDQREAAGQALAEREKQGLRSSFILDALQRSKTNARALRDERSFAIETFTLCASLGSEASSMRVAKDYPVEKNVNKNVSTGPSLAGQHGQKSAIGRSSDFRAGPASLLIGPFFQKEPTMAKRRCAVRSMLGHSGGAVPDFRRIPCSPVVGRFARPATIAFERSK